MLILTKNLFAQPGGNGAPVVIPCSLYTPNPDLDKFVGTWKWISGSNYFTLILKKEKVLDNWSDDYSCKDLIIGYHEYGTNNATVESSMQYQNSNYYEEKHSISSWSIVINNKELRGGMYNISKGNNFIKFEFELTDDTHIKIKSLKNYEGAKFYPPGVPIPSSDINLPQGIILTKQ